MNSWSWYQKNYKPPGRTPLIWLTDIELTGTYSAERHEGKASRKAMTSVSSDLEDDSPRRLGFQEQQFDETRRHTGLGREYGNRLRGTMLRMVL